MEANGNLSVSHMGSPLVFVRLKQLGIRFSSLICLRWRLWQRTCLPRQETETWVQFLGQEDPLEEEMVAHSSVLTWEIPQTEESGRLQSTGSQRVRHD